MQPIKFLALFLVIFIPNYCFAQNGNQNEIVQINGVIMTADSLHAVSNATVLVVNKNRGVYANDNGVFSLVCTKGDTLHFSCIGFRDKKYVIPTSIPGTFISLIQLMTQDTFYLPETIIHPKFSKRTFNYVFQHSHIADDQYETARKNTNSYTLRALLYTTPKSAAEMVTNYQNLQWTKTRYYGQQPPMDIFSPLKWAEFFEAWKRGDFRNKKQNDN